MAWRVTQDEVLDILGSSTYSDLSPFIEVANQLVTELLESEYTDSADESSGFPSSRLKEIERWLSAHFVSIGDPETKSIDLAGEIQETYFGKVDLRLQQTRFGQMVLVLDTSGAFAEQNNKPDKKNPAGTSAEIKWLGSSDAYTS